MLHWVDGTTLKVFDFISLVKFFFLVFFLKKILSLNLKPNLPGLTLMLECT